MNDPKRLLEDGQVGGEMQAILRAIERPEAPSEGKLAALGQQLSVAGAASAAAPASALWLKVALAGGVVVAAAGGLWALQPAAPAPARMAAPAPPSLRAPEPASPSPSPAPLPAAEPAAPAEPAVVPRTASSKENSADTLAEEARLLERARRAKGSAPGAALALLEQHRQKYPRGELAAERMFLSVEVLNRLGNKAASERQADALIRQYPRSVYATQLKARQH